MQLTNTKLFQRNFIYLLIYLEVQLIYPLILYRVVNDGSFREPGAGLVEPERRTQRQLALFTTSRSVPLYV